MTKRGIGYMACNSPLYAVLDIFFNKMAITLNWKISCFGVGLMDPCLVNGILSGWVVTDFFSVLLCTVVS